MSFVEHGVGGGVAEFGRVQPIQTDSLLRVGNVVGQTDKRINLGATQDTLENGLIVQVTPEGAFRPGQQILLWLTVYNGTQGQDPNAPWISRVRLKPWFKRASEEKRGPGDPGNTQPVGEGWIGNDELQFGSGPNAAASPTSSVHADNNRLVWFPVPKVLDVTQYQPAPPPPGPPASPARQSDSLLLDDVWTMDLQDPNGAAYAATRGLTQVNYGRSATFLYISHGYALGLTHQFDVVFPTGGPVPTLFIDLTWIVGAL